MTKPKTALGPWHKGSLYGATALVWLSGGLWLVDKHFRQVPSDFGLQAPTTQAWWLALHGAAAMALLVILGSLLPEHVRLGWRRQTQRPSGGFLLGICGFLALTGWGLYYVGDRDLRGLVSLAHWIAGLALPAIIALHVLLARRRESTASSAR
jgi:hypothetical protein